MDRKARATALRPTRRSNSARWDGKSRRTSPTCSQGGWPAPWSAWFVGSAQTLSMPTFKPPFSDILLLRVSRGGPFAEQFELVGGERDPLSLQELVELALRRGGNACEVAVLFPINADVSAFKADDEVGPLLPPDHPDPV